MKHITLLVTVGLLAALPVRQAQAWDEITHGRITDQAVSLVRDPQLKAFLQQHRDAVQSGSEFPDWGHAIKPHGDTLHATYLDFAYADLTAPGASSRPGYNAFLAHYLGAYAHVVEDRLLDCTLKEHAKVVHERRDDMENGMLAIAGMGSLRRDFERFVPHAELARIYEQAGYFGDKRLSAATLSSVMQQGMEAAIIQNQLLKFLSFLSYDWARREFPWGDANIVQAPGGFESNAQAVAAGWEAIWAELHNRPAPAMVYTQPGDGGLLASANRQDAYGRITVITRQRIKVSALDPAWVHLVGERTGPMAVTVRPYLLDGEHDDDLAFQIESRQAWTPGETYRLTIDGLPDAAGHQVASPISIALRAPTEPQFTQRSQAPQPWRMGVFLAVVVGGLGGAIGGAPDALRLALGTSRPWRLARTLAYALGLSLAGLALWLLATDGVVVISYLRLHH